MMYHMWAFPEAIFEDSTEMQTDIEMGVFMPNGVVQTHQSVISTVSEITFRKYLEWSTTE
jgi:hypothetical protein